MLRTAANRPAGPASIFAFINVHFFVLNTQKELHKALMDPVRATQKMEREFPERGEPSEVTTDFLDPMARVFAKNAGVGAAFKQT